MKESETIEFKKSLAELKAGIVSVVDILRRIHMVEAWGRGMPLILKNAPNVQFREISHIFIASFDRSSFEEEQPFDDGRNVVKSVCIDNYL